MKQFYRIMYSYDTQPTYLTESVIVSGHTMEQGIENAHKYIKKVTGGLKCLLGDIKVIEAYYE